MRWAVRVRVLLLRWGWSFYFTESDPLDFVAPIPGAECWTFLLVGENSPR